MQATTINELNRIARAGAAKMDREGYKTEAVAGVPHVYRVTNPEGTTYRVSIDPATGGYCGCKFYSENRAIFPKETCTCKHMQFLRNEEAYIARIEEEAQKYNDPDYLEYRAGVR